MKGIAKALKEDREALFRNTSSKYGVAEAIVEKDFWVCWTLMYLFEESPWKDGLSFKGGTSLSKGFGLIERFSEDIDLVLNWQLLGCSSQEAWKKRSNRKQGIFNAEINRKASQFLGVEVLTKMKEDFKSRFNEEFDLYIDQDDPQTICFVYPQSYKDEAILSLIRLEIGPLAAWTPSSKIPIASYAAEAYPNVFTKPSVDILTVTPERTFWEKITILHKEAFRTNGNVPKRYSRHYYDVYCLASSDVKGAAFSNQDMLDEVVAFKKKFYPSNTARYDLAKPGTMKLVPSEENWDKLREDYRKMESMIYGKRPGFEKLMEVIMQLQIEINAL